MAISGNLRTMAPGDLLQWLSLAQKTGTLFVSNGAVEKKVFFRNGRVISSASNDPREYLGQFLMSHGYIDEAELKKAMEVQAQSRILLGKILVTINAISEQDLLRLMRLKAEEEIYDIFLWKEGEFRFVDDELPQMEMVPLQVDVTGIIMEGTRRIDEWDRIRKLVAGKNLIPVVEKTIDFNALPDAQRKILQAINGHRSIEELVLESRSSHFTVSKTIYEYVRTGDIRLIEPHAPVAAPVAPPEVVSEAAADEDETAALLLKAQFALKKGEFDKALRTLKAAQNLEPTNQKITNALKGAEAVIGAELSKEGIVASRVPKIVKTFEEISGMNFSPNEGFILSRINGMWDLGSIMKISPMREIDAMLIFQRLKKDGIISL